MWLYYFYLVSSFLATKGPFWLGTRLADLAGSLTYHLNARARRQSHQNLRRVLGPQSAPSRVRAVSAAAFRTAAHNYYDLFRLPGASMGQEASRIMAKGWEHLEQALAEGKGAIVAAPHMGSFEMMTQLAAGRSIAVTVPIERLKPDRLFRLMVDMRSHQGTRVVPADRGALRAMCAALRRNEVVVIAADRDVLGMGMEVEFFGEKAKLPTAPAVISLRTGAPLLVAYTLQRPGGFYYVEVFPPVPRPTTGDARQQVLAVTQAVTSAIESVISRYPEQWVVFQPVWPDQPVPSPSLVGG